MKDDKIRSLSGAGVGGLMGAGVGSLSGNSTIGTLVGLGLGGLAGYYSKNFLNKDI